MLPDTQLMHQPPLRFGQSSESKPKDLKYITLSLFWYKRKNLYS